MSILWANAGTGTFVYITAPDQTSFDAANNIVKTREGEFANDLSLLANEMAKDAKRKFTLNYGAVRILRASLVEIR